MNDGAKLRGEAGHVRSGKYFAEIAPLLPPTHAGPPDERALGAVMARYGLEMDFESIPVLVERHRLVSGEPTSPA